MSSSAATPRRLWRSLTVPESPASAMVSLFVAAMLCGALVALGGSLAMGPARGDPPRRVWTLVVRTSAMSSARDAIALVPGLRLDSQRGIGEVIGSDARIGTADRLQVIEVSAAGGPNVPETPEETAAALRTISGVVDVHDGAVAHEAAVAPSEASRLRSLASSADAAIGTGAAPPLGWILVACGILGLGLGLTRAALRLAHSGADELRARWLLGARQRDLWRPVALWTGVPAVAGVVAAPAALALAASRLAPGLTPEAGGSLLVAAVLATIGVASTAVLAAREAVRTTLRGFALGLVLAATVALPVVLPPPAAGAGDPTIEELRTARRELATQRRHLHDLERLESRDGRAALRALLAGDEVGAGLHRARRDVLANEAERTRDAIGIIEARCQELREQLASAHGPAGEIGPRMGPLRTPRVLAAFAPSATGSDAKERRSGVLLRGRASETVVAAAAGRVVFAGRIPGAGEVIVVNHGHRTFSIYGGVEGVAVIRGMDVDLGEPLARLGARPLLFAVRARGRPVDPLDWLRRGPPRPAPPVPPTGSES